MPAALGLLGEAAEPGAHGGGAPRLSPAPHGSGRRRRRRLRSAGCSGGVPRGLGGAASSTQLAGARRAVRAPRLHGALCSALPLLAGSRAEGGPSYPDVRSPGLSGGGGEAARAAITRETAPSCHQPSVLLLSRGVLSRGGEGLVPPAAPASHKWAQRAHPRPPRL